MRSGGGDPEPTLAAPGGSHQIAVRGKPARSRSRKGPSTDIGFANKAKSMRCISTHLCAWAVQSRFVPSAKGAHLTLLPLYYAPEDWSAYRPSSHTWAKDG